MTSIPKIALYQLNPLMDETKLPRGDRIAHDWLRFDFNDGVIEIYGEYSRRGRWADLLVNARDLEQTCKEIVSERARIAAEPATEEHWPPSSPYTSAQWS